MGIWKSDLLALQRFQRPSITLRGLSETTNPAKDLKCLVLEARPSLHNFGQRVMEIFVSKGYIPAVKGTFRIAGPKLMETSFLGTNIPNTKTTMLGKGYMRWPSFDTSEFYPKYKDFPWSAEFPLKKLCISKTRLKDVWRRQKLIKTGYQDISIPLPGVSVDDFSANPPDNYYERACKTKFKNKPGTQLIIPSSGQLYSDEDL